MRHLKRFDESSLVPGEGRPEHDLIMNIKDRLLDLEDLGGVVKVSENEFSDIVNGARDVGYFVEITFESIQFHKYEGSSFSYKELDIDKFINEKNEQVKLFNQAYVEYTSVIKEIKSMCKDSGYKINLLGMDSAPGGITFAFSFRRDIL